MNRFFINYCVGARGDFLTNCLYDVEFDWQLLNNLKNSPKMPPPISYCVKTHGTFDHSIYTDIENFPKEFGSWKELFDTVNSFNLIKLKIVTNSIEECIDSVWFTYTKTVLNNTAKRAKLVPTEIQEPTVEFIYEHMDSIIKDAIFRVAFTQDFDKELQHEYDYVINFEDLFDAEYIRDLFKKINGRDMDYARFRAIQKNIAMQYRLSKSEFYPMFKDKLDRIHTLF